MCPTPGESRHTLSGRKYLRTEEGTLLPFPEAAPHTFLALLLTHPAIGPEIFDRQLAAAMREHGVGTIYTFNLGDFAGIPSVTAQEPPVPASPVP